MNNYHLSKMLSFILRHNPQSIDLQLDKNGWADVSELLQKMALHGKQSSLEQLKDMVANNDKKRFAFSEDFSKIRASQGHSIHIDLALVATQPPDLLFHGTAEKNLLSIKGKGLLKGKRQHVHLSIDQETATKVGKRHGKPIVLKINTLQMAKDGILFYLSDNNVWLTDFVEVKYIDF